MEQVTRTEDKPEKAAPRLHDRRPVGRLMVGRGDLP